MLQLMHRRPERIVMTLDSIGGVWRYAMDLAAGLGAYGVRTIFAGFGPPPDAQQRREAEAIGELVWHDLQLDWTAASETELEDVTEALQRLIGLTGADLAHLNLPSQAVGLSVNCPVVSVSHSCVVSWFRAVRGEPVPAGWAWQHRLNQEGLRRSDLVITPSHSHAGLLRECYGSLEHMAVVPNATAAPRSRQFEKGPFVFAAARWWDEGKNAQTLDQATGAAIWPIVAAGAAEAPSGARFNFTHVQHLGQRSAPETRDLAARASIFVSPSRYEPFGLAALEAARAGTAMVLSDIPTYRELWNGAALFASPGDPTAFAKAINRLARAPSLRAELGAKAARLARGFTPERQASTMLGFYSALTSRAMLRARQGT